MSDRESDSRVAHAEAVGPGLDPSVRMLLKKLADGAPLPQLLRVFTRDLGLRRRELGILGEVDRKTLVQWQKGGDGNTPQQFDDLRRIVVLLIETGAMRPRSVAGWLRSRNVGLSMHPPLDILQDGEFPLVLKAAEAASGGRVPLVEIPHRAVS